MYNHYSPTSVVASHCGFSCAIVCSQRRPCACSQPVLASATCSAVPSQSGFCVIRDEFVIRAAAPSAQAAILREGLEVFVNVRIIVIVVKGCKNVSVSASRHLSVAASKQTFETKCKHVLTL